MATIDTVLLKVVARCNLDCSYCYVYHMGDDGWRSQPKRLPPDVEVAVVDQLGELARSQQRGFSVVLHGGEPLQLGAPRLAQMFARMRHVLPPTCGLHLQTNGVLLTRAIIDACAVYDVGVSISLDGPKAVHDALRVDRQGRGSYDRVVAAIGRLRGHPLGTRLFSGVLAVVDPRSDALSVYNYLKSTGAPTIDFLYRDGNHSHLPFGKRHVCSTEYGEWMIRILDAYIVDPAPPRIRLLDDMLKLILGGDGIKEGVGLTDYGILVIETDGTVNKNDTLKSAFRGADRYSRSWSVLHDRLVDVVRTHEFRTHHEAQRPISAICMSCPELGICGGGMPAHRWSEEREFDNPSVFCDDQKAVITRMRQWIARQRSAAA
jgi:uncharacterized protein